MREFKFRFWMGNYVKPIYQYSDNLIKLEQESDCPILADYLMTKRAEIVKEQYTGLKDKNGKEIYEGDTIKYQDRDYSEVFGQGDVYYDGDDCMFKIRCNNVILFFMNLLGEELEVIGNIHDKENDDEKTN